MKKQILMSRISIFIMLVGIVVLFSGCIRTPYELYHEDDMIESIEIIMVEECSYISSREVKVTYETLVVISDKKAFLADFREISFSLYTWGDPLDYPLISGFEAILVEYNNGDKEYIQSEQIVLNKEGMLITDTRRSSDYEEWKALLDKYLAK